MQNILPHNSSHSEIEKKFHKENSDAQELTDSQRLGVYQPKISPELKQGPPFSWLGVLVRQYHSSEYLRYRDILADASKCGDWETVLHTIDEGATLFHEPWANAVRLRMHHKKRVLNTLFKGF